MQVNQLPRARYRSQLARAIAIAEAVKQKPLTLRELTKCVVERTKTEVSERTVRRDAYSMAELGYVVVKDQKYSRPEVKRAD